MFIHTPEGDANKKNLKRQINVNNFFSFCWNIGGNISTFYVANDWCTLRARVKKRTVLPHLVTLLWRSNFRYQMFNVLYL